MNCIVVTNNDLLCEIHHEKVVVEGSSLDVMMKARDYVHKGYKLLNSPISASIRMILSPVKSILVSPMASTIDEESLFQIEAAIEKHIALTARRKEDQIHIHDYKTIDKALTLSAMDELKNFYGGESIEIGAGNY